MDKLPKIIGICGKKRSGKDTIAKYLCDRYGYEHHKISEDLKTIVKILFGFTDNQVENDEKDVKDPKWGIAPREAMQFIGTEIMQKEIQKLLVEKNVGRNFWIHSFIEKHIINSSKLIVISDLRFIHEYEVLKNHKVYVIRVDRFFTPISDNEHESEKEFLDIPYNVCINNTKGVEELQKELDNIFNQI